MSSVKRSGGQDAHGHGKVQVMGEILLQIVWVAAHHHLRNDWRNQRSQLHKLRWPEVFAISSMLGNPSAPGGPL